MTVKLDGAALQIEDGAPVARPDEQALTLLEPLAKDDLLGWRSRAAMEAIHAVIPSALDLVRSDAVVEAVGNAIEGLE